jgi:hypothetical protein
MLRTVLIWFGFALCLGALGSVFDGLYHSSQLQECVSQPAGQPSEDYIVAFVAKVRLYRDCVGSFVEEHGETTTAVFTVILAVSTIGLWLVTGRSVTIARRTLTDLERPYIFILDFNWLPIVNKSGEEKPERGWVYTVANGGRLPATIRRVSVGVAIRHRTIPVQRRQRPHSNPRNRNRTSNRKNFHRI